MEELADYCCRPADERSGAWLDHLAQCARCASVVNHALEPDLADATPALRSHTGEWRREMARRFAREGRSGSRLYRRYAAIAAAALVVAGAGVWWNERRLSEPSVLLAEAYTEARPFEYRLPDRGYGPVRQARGVGSVFDRPAALSRAESEIQRRLATHGGDPEWLSLKGQAQLLEGDYEGAIDSLTRALEAQPGDPQWLTELGTAYAVRGATEQRNIDYGHAMDLFLQARRKKPEDERNLFNLALTYEHLSLIEEARQTWDDLLRRTRDPGWRREAEAHRAALDKILNEKKKAGNSLLQDPAAFAARFGNSRDFDPERYQDVFWSDWASAIGSNAAAVTAAGIEAAEFQRRFGDGYLADILRALRQPAGPQAIADLSKAVMLNRTGKTDRAAPAARQAASEFQALGGIAGVLRAKVELAYAVKRQSSEKKEQECLEATDAVIRQAGVRSYAWLSGQAHLEHAGCSEQLSRFGAARNEIAAALQSLTRSGIALLALRASGYVTGQDRLSGNYTPVWEDGPPGLHHYWTSAASPLRAQDFQFNMQWSAKAMGWMEAAAVLDRAAVHSLEQAGNPEMEVINRLYLANLLEENREYPDAAAEFQRAQGLFRSIDPGPTRDALQWLAQLQRCEAESAAGHSRDVIGELDSLSTGAGSRPLAEQMRLHQVRGLALLNGGEWREAGESFQNAVDSNQRKVNSLGGYLDRVPVLESAAPSYRNLAEIQLLHMGDTTRSLRTWLLYQGVPAGDFADELARGRENGLSLVYGILPSQVIVWSISRGGLRSRIVAAPVSKVESACRRFLRLCSSPNSSESEIRQVGAQLFSWLLAPELRDNPDGTVYLRTDSWLAAIPFAAFVDEAGRYAGLDRSFVNLVGPGATRGLREEPITRDSPALIVSVPRAEAPGHQALPFLETAEAEAAEISRYFRRSVLLQDAAASPESIASSSGRARLFHFSGHGWTNGGDGALVLAAASDGSPRFETFREIAMQDWRQCSLAVLSACLTAAGEERGAIDNRSLVRAILQAGARRVIAARWSVDSAGTHALMSEFYSRLLSGQPVSRSLGGAAADLAASRNWSHPFYWAAFDTFSTLREP
ncbi:MAG TPA: CHAT domain-containing protein [Bryobacteraceae bacterium]|nr:CHAT domain-containing protein [Bryobacteraceae bacterium]